MPTESRQALAVTKNPMKCCSRPSFAAVMMSATGTRRSAKVSATRTFAISSSPSLPASSRYCSGLAQNFPGASVVTISLMQRLFRHGVERLQPLQHPLGSEERGAVAHARRVERVGERLEVLEVPGAHRAVP